MKIKETINEPIWKESNQFNPIIKLGKSSALSETNRKTKIICTLGQSVATPEAICELMDCGMDMARVNLARTASYEAQIEVRDAFLEACQRHHQCPLAVELQGPSLRIGKLPEENPIPLQKGHKLMITSNRHYDTSESLVYCDCLNLPLHLQKGSRILLGKGRVSLVVTSIQPESHFKFTQSTPKGYLPLFRPRIQNMSMMEVPVTSPDSKEKSKLEEENKNSTTLQVKEKWSIEEQLTDQIFHRIVHETELLPIPSPIFSVKSNNEVLKEVRVPVSKKKEKMMIVCEVEYDCELRQYMEVCIPGLGLKKDLGINIIDVKDIKAMSFWVESGANFVIVPHVESEEDIEDVRELIGSRPIKILAKIQNSVSLKNLSSIIQHSDGIVIGRGWLALNLSPAHLVFVQDYIIYQCRLQGKPVILGSPFMDSMLHNPIPTRAETADVILAVRQGADGIILGGITFMGDFYLDAVQRISNTCLETERHLQ